MTKAKFLALVAQGSACRMQVSSAPIVWQMPYVELLSKTPFPGAVGWRHRRIICQARTRKAADLKAAKYQKWLDEYYAREKQS